VSHAPETPRLLGVIECFTAVVRQCPKAAARTMAESALATVEREGSRALAEQAYLVLSALSGWHGERAAQVRRSLQAFLAGAQS